jgi:hypothetical protein
MRSVSSRTSPAKEAAPAQSVKAPGPQVYSSCERTEIKSEWLPLVPKWTSNVFYNHSLFQIEYW